MQQKNNWFNSLLAAINGLSEELGLDDFATGRMRDFIVDVAKKQYSVGSKSGAAWAFKQAREGGNGSAAPAS